MVGVAPIWDSVRGVRRFTIQILALALYTSLAGLSSPARADELRVPPGLMLCRTIDAVASKAHAGCYLARGGQRVEIIAVLPTCAQLRIWSSNGAESTIVYARRQDAERLH
jgi:hypothetical protein